MLKVFNIGLSLYMNKYTLLWWEVVYVVWFTIGLTLNVVSFDAEVIGQTVLI